LFEKKILRLKQMAKKRKSTSQKQKQSQKVVIQIGRHAPRRRAARSTIAQQPKGHMPSFSFHGGVTNLPQSRNDQPTMYRELYESERKKVHHLRAAQSVQQAQTTAALVGNREVEVADLLRTEAPPTRIHSHPLVARLSTLQNVERDALGMLPLGRPQELGTIGNSLRQSKHLELSPLSSAREGGHFAPEDSRKASQILGESAIERVLADRELGARTEDPIADAEEHGAELARTESDTTVEGAAQMSHERFHPELLRTSIADQDVRDARGEYGQTWTPPLARSSRHAWAEPEAQEPVMPYDEHVAQGGGGGGGGFLPPLFGQFRGGSLSSLTTAPLPGILGLPPAPQYGGALALRGEFLAPDAGSGEGAEEGAEEGNSLERTRKSGSGRKHGSRNKEPPGSLAARREGSSGLSFV